MRRHLLATVGILVLAAIVATSAQGDGGPGPGVLQGWDGIAHGSVRYVAFATGSGTVVEVVQRRGGPVLPHSRVTGEYRVPEGAHGGTAGWGWLNRRHFCPAGPPASPPRKKNPPLC